MDLSTEGGAAIRQLLDIEAIKQLKARYCFSVDAGDWDTLEQLWTEDACCDYGFFGRFEGRTRIMDVFFRQLVANATSFNAHMVHNPVIEIDGDTATGAWYLTAQTIIQPQNQAIWAMGVYRDEFRRVDGNWKIAALNVEFKYYTPFEDGWAKTRIWEIPF
ncbi:MAG: nuclear transport factor 2 family protein [Pseudomonadales bacterium]|nr:nuclear transport factor 2 family protein [Pseudomonadales bacterium]